MFFLYRNMLLKNNTVRLRIFLWMCLCRHHHHHHHHKHQWLDPLIRSVSRVTTALANVSSVFQLFSFLVVCSDMISKGFGLVAVTYKLIVFFIYRNMLLKNNSVRLRIFLWMCLCHHHHHHKHQGLDPLIRSVSRVTTAVANVSSVFQLFSFLVVCSDMISKGFGLVAFFASVKTSSVCIHLSCPVCIQSAVHGVRSRLFCGHKGCSLLEVSKCAIVCLLYNYITNRSSLQILWLVLWK